MATHSNLEHASALLALHATRGNAPRGPAPQDEELALLLEGRLDFTRRQQIYSHLNASPELYRRWLALVEAGSAASIKEAGAAKIWRARFAWLAGSGALAGLSALLLLAPWREQVLAPGIQTPRVNELPYSASARVILPEEITMVAAGILDTLSGEQREYRARLLAIAVSDARESDYRAFGASLGQLHNACATGVPVATALQANIQSQAQALPWPAGALSLTMARAGIEEDLCLLAEELRNEVMQLDEP